MSAKIIPVILCGGSGTRLWPLSREAHPKQFVDLGDGETLFGRTLKRLKAIPNCEAPICVCNEKHRFYVAAHMPKGRLILEPAARNTAPAVALAALAVNVEDKDALILVLPADHHFADDEAFGAAIEKGIPAANAGRIVTFGLLPDSPATGFGYIKQGETIDPGASLVEKFVEKPDLATAREMLASGGYLWNAGIFMAKPSILLEEFKKHAPDIYEACCKAFADSVGNELMRPNEEVYKSCPENSIDYAIMEHTDKAAVVPLKCGWNDMGSWEAFYEMADKDTSANAVIGRALLEDVRSSYIHSSSRLVAAIGLDNVIIAETPDAVLVTTREQGQKIKQIVATLKKEGASEFQQHRLVQKPWGSYEVLAIADRFQVKRIVVNPGHAISLQMHHHRAEHWIIASGTAEITNGNETRIYTENQSTYIPVGITHKLRNPGLIPLVLIEIQTGSYLGEDDIVRYEDPYKRNGRE